MIKKVSILLILLHQFFYAKLQPAQNFVITQYNEVDGISSKSVSDILQSKQGYLWLSTYEGLIRFDGYVFKTYRNTGNSSAFAKIAEDKEGNLWMVLNNGTLAKFNPATESFTNITIKYPALKAGEKAGSAECIFIDNENTLWLGVTRTGFVQINKETGEAVIHNIISENDNYYTPELRKFYNRVLAVYEDADQILWMATPDGLYTLNKRNEQLTHITKRPAKNNVNWRDDNYRTLLAAGNKLYIGCWGGGLTVYDRKSGSFENYKFNTENFNSYTNNIIHSLVAVNDSTIFIASPDKGLLSFNINTKKFTYYSGNKNYSSIPLWLWKKIIKDRDNNIWALNENGLMQLHLPTYKFNFNPFPVTHTDNHIFYSISAVLDEEKYRFVGTSYADGLHIINKKNNTATIVRDETAPGEEDISTILKVYRDKLKNLWVLGKDYVYLLDEKKVVLKKINQPPKYENKQSNSYATLTEDSCGNIWLGSLRNGAFAYNTTTQKITHLSINGDYKLPTNLITCIATDKLGRVWLCSNRGFLSFCKKGKFEIESNAVINKMLNGLAQTKAFDLFIDSKGFLWVSTLNELLKIDCNTIEPKLVKRFTTADGLKSDNAAGLAEDKNGNIWGMQLNVYAAFMIDGKTSKIYNYGLRDGINHSGDVDKVIKLNDTTMWLLGQGGGYYQFNPLEKNVNKKQTKPVVTIFAVNSISRYYEEDIKTNGKVILWPQQNSFYFEFSALDFGRPEQYQYAYMLEGFDTVWTYSGSRRAVSYTNIPGGDYVFKVKATTVEGDWNVAEAKIPIYINTPFYKKWWFILCTALILLLSLIALSRFRLLKQRQIMLLETKTQALAKEKTLVQYENLKQHLNPHFLFNSLTSLSSLIRINQQQAIKFLDGMSKIYRYILQRKDEETVTLKEEIEFIQIFISLQQTRLGKGLQVNINISDAYLTNKIVPVTLQNLIENAIKHNIIDEDSPLYIDIFTDNNYLVIKNNLQKKNFVETSNKQGLENLISLYKYLSPNPVIITEDAQSFIVKLPLL